MLLCSVKGGFILSSEDAEAVSVPTAAEGTSAVSQLKERAAREGPAQAAEALLCRSPLTTIHSNKT